MAWRDDEARAHLIGQAEAKLLRGDTPSGFPETLFGRTRLEDLSALDALALAVLAEQAWDHLRRRTLGYPDIRVVDPVLPGGREISVVEILNDNMPFLFDSVMAELTEQGYEVQLVAHPIVAVERDAEGRLVHFLGLASPEQPQGARESLIHIHVPRLSADADRQRLIEGLGQTLAGVRACTVDWKPMVSAVKAAVDGFRAYPPPVPVDEREEACLFLDWLCADNFTFLGLREHRFSADEGSSEDIDEGRGLGILRDPGVKVLRRGTELVTMSAEIRQFMREPTLLIVTKANVNSRIHRRVRMDYIGVKLYTPEGRIKGELRLVGLFTSSAYTGSVRQIPYVRLKVAQVLQRAGLDPESHSGRSVLHILEGYPRDELVQVDVGTLYDFVMEILLLYERPRVRVLARADKFDRFVSVLVFIPRDKYDSAVRQRVGLYLAEAYKGRVSAAYASFPEGPLARVHYIIGRYDADTPVIARDALEAEVGAIATTWADKLRAALAGSMDGMRARALGARYANAFSGGYAELFDARQALDDIARVERLTATRPVSISVYRRADEDVATRFDLKVFSFGAPLALSYRVPIIENHGLRVINERTYRIAPNGQPGGEVWLHDLNVETADGEPVLLDDDLSGRLETSFMAIVGDRAESDGYNALILRTALGWRDVAAIRALSRYLHQIRAPFSQGYMAETLRKNVTITTRLAALFRIRFDPRLEADEAERAAREAEALAEIGEHLKTVSSLDEDRILRRFVNLIGAAVRTNFWQIAPNGFPPSVISFKFESRKIELLPRPRPLYEIFVYSPRVEGIHLRFGKVARGGLRWSDRPQDFRTEILGLVKAQQVKNAVIVPVGAKGGFLPKRLPSPSDREAWIAEGTEAYRIFIRSLLELTDNLEGDHVVSPANTLRHDGDDPYLVVAADKGTATFSDTANALSLEKHHWLGDAFASGGSQGYDHKRMGITARGAWEAVKRHFRELGTDVQTEPFTVVGVGDMSGDVFGNGMLLSPMTRLVAAFDHRDIFLDPDPDMAGSFSERRRMFDLPRSSWQDYDRSRLSAGGGVFSRSLKVIPLSPEARALLDLDQDEATPAEVMSAILRAKADLLWFGGIGTYVRATAESDEGVGDRANDAIRVTGLDVRARVIGEGANLGITQRGRIEAAMNGTRLNTDAIDNSAGVNTSDLEVNIKIALSRPERDGRLNEADRNALLAGMTEAVGHLVLRNNYLQTLALSVAERKGTADTGVLGQLMRGLEQRGLLDRAVEFLPDDAALTARMRGGTALSRPELAVLLAYAKLTLYDEILASGVPDEPYLGRELTGYFPAILCQTFPDAVQHHRLRREIIATVLANGVINRGGPASVFRLRDETGADLSAIVQAFATVNVSFGLEGLYGALDRLDTKIDGALQLDLYTALQDFLLARVAWFVRHVVFGSDLETVIARFKGNIATVAAMLDVDATEDMKALRRQRRQRLTDQGIPADVAGRFADLDALVAVPDIVLVAEGAGRGVETAAQAFFALQQHLRLGEIIGAAREIPCKDGFERLAVDHAINEIGAAQRRLVGAMLTDAAAGTGGLQAWMDTSPPLGRTLRLTREIATGDLTLPKLVVLMNALAAC